MYTRRLYGSLPRSRVYLLTQMRTGHNWLSTYTKVHRFRDDDHCASGVQEKKFTSKVTPGLPQSELDKMIFLPDWKLRPKWGWKKVRLTQTSCKWCISTNKTSGKHCDELITAWSRGSQLEGSKTVGAHHASGREIILGRRSLSQFASLIQVLSQ